MRVWLSTYGSRGDVEPTVALAGPAVVAAELLLDTISRDPSRRS
ncbi:hypothetical protein ACIBQ1_59360 [Nonomuraea sp. NPDC050153]